MDGWVGVGVGVGVVLAFRRDSLNMKYALNVSDAGAVHDWQKHFLTHSSLNRPCTTPKFPELPITARKNGCWIQSIPLSNLVLFCPLFLSSD